MGWFGYASMVFFFFGLTIIPKVASALGKALDVFAWVPWPWLNLYLGVRSGGSFSFLSGLLACWIFAALTIAASVRFSIWGAEQGLSGNFGAADASPSVSRAGATKFGKEPLYRKEFLWFIRDRSAIVQTILIPITLAGFQVFNLRGLLAGADGAWNYLCGVAILFGTYFLSVLGPKSLASEGNAPVDFLDLAPGPGKFAESQSLAVVDDVVWGWSRWCCATPRIRFPKTSRKSCWSESAGLFSAGAWLKKR
jgi:hypothetical protein